VAVGCRDDGHLRVARVRTDDIEHRRRQCLPHGHGRSEYKHPCVLAEVLPQEFSRGRVPTHRHTRMG
jgi:hypothetical protein